MFDAPISQLDQHQHDLATPVFKPDLRLLAHVLRHRELWPEGFVWNYSSCTHCAMGLAFQLWPDDQWRPDEGGGSWHGWISRKMDIPLEIADQIFFGTLPPGAWNYVVQYVFDRHAALQNVTPEMVAMGIDRYLDGR
jgi:hypothetical protein